MTARLELRGITKAYPGTLANDAIDLAIDPGQIHALLGENGAGKSTLVKILYGVLRADAGEILWDGAPVQITSPKAARALGIGMVFQHFSLFEALTVAENIELGMDDAGDRHTLEARISDLATRYGLPLEPRRHVHTLSVGEKQRIEIIRALLQNPSLMVLDEPTSVLTPQEADTLLATLRKIADEGRSILYISHKLAEIKALCHHATILRAGRVVATCDPTQESAQSMAELMIGARLTPPRRSAAAAATEPCLVVRGLSAPADDQFGINLSGVDLTVNAGEVVGIAGVAGNGQSELTALLTGERLAPAADMIVLGDEAVGRLGPNQRRDRAAAFVPEERIGHSTVPEMSLIENALLTSFRRKGFMRGGFVNLASAQRLAEVVCKTFNVKHPGVRHAARSLSGGNLQKFAIGREIDHEPRLLVANQPTWGVDSGAAAAIQQALIDLAKTGAGVLVISQDLDELLAISDRIAVLHVGELSPARPTSELSVQEIGLLMAGHPGTGPDETKTPKAKTPKVKKKAKKERPAA